jgi:hypothetical protein
MSRSAYGLGLLAAVLLATISLELWFGAPASDTMAVTTPDRVSGLATDPNLTPPPDHRPERAGEWVSIILDRPLFKPGRRPMSEEPTPLTVPDDLPRLCGIIVSPYARSAVFAARDGGRPTVVDEGGKLGDFTVKSIEAERVTIVAGSSERALRPSAEGTLAVGASPANPIKEYMPVSLLTIPNKHANDGGAGDDSAGLSIPDLTHMRLQDREYWVERWRQETARLSPLEQQAARERMRLYWQHQWNAAWGNNISKLPLHEQTGVRRKIATYWH